MAQTQALRYSLRQLEVFLGVAREQTTSAAALDLAMSQSAVSAALKSLESAYGVELFDRVGKRLVLNAVGKRLRPRAEALVAHAREFEADIAGHDQIGDLTIGASYTIANHLAVDYLARWLESFPDARIDIATGNSPEIVTRVLDYEVELGMIENEVNHPDLDLVPWLEDELIVFCSPEHPLANKRRLSDADLASARWILREKGSGARQRFDQTFASLLPGFRVYLEFRHNQPIQRAVEKGLGVSCLSEKVLRPYFDAGTLVPLTLSERFRMRRTLFLVRRKRRYYRPAVEAFIRLCTAGD